MHLAKLFENWNGKMKVSLFFWFSFHFSLVPWLTLEREATDEEREFCRTRKISSWGNCWRQGKQEETAGLGK